MMRRLVALALLIFSIGLTSGIAQTEHLLDPMKGPTPQVRDALPVMPSSYVVDDATILTPELFSSISSKAIELAARQNVHIYVVTSIYVLGDTSQQRARRLADMWLKPKNRYGAIIVYDQGARGKDAIGLACADDGSGVLDQADLYRLLTNSHDAATGAVGSTGQRVDAAFRSLEMGFRELKPRLDRGRWASKQQLFLIGMIIASMLLTLLLLALVKWLEKRHEAKHRTTYLFPEVSVLPRFGAIHGGGVMAQADFRSVSTIQK